MDLSIQQTLDTDPNAIQQINFPANLGRGRAGDSYMLFICEQVKETILDFLLETECYKRVPWISFGLSVI